MNPQPLIYGVCYRFTLLSPTAENDARFVEIWSAITNYFKTHCGALGSRLHLGEDGAFYAYAQWPSEAVFKAVSEHIPNPDFMKIRLEWAELCAPSEVLFEGPMLRDLTA